MHGDVGTMASLWLLASMCWLSTGQTAAGATTYQISLPASHPWRPPFGLARVGQPPTVVVEASQRPELSSYTLTVLHGGKTAGVHPVSFPAHAPYSATLTLTEYGDQVVLCGEKPDGTEPIELARQPLQIPRVEFDAVASPESVINPVDLGTILVPHGWLLLGPGQSGVLEVAAISRDKDEPQARIRAWFGTASGRESSTLFPLKQGHKALSTLKLPEPPASVDRDVLHVALVDDRGEPVAEQSIPVMLVHTPPRWPRFGASYTKLRFDAPISVRDPRTGAFSSLPYAQGWDPQLRDVVVSLPSGSRFVFWRGSSYIPFWAGKQNTGACYEWAEMMSRPEGVVDCVEPLMDKELRYGRVEIVESTASRVQVRWTYQSTDLKYQVWGDEAVEDYVFYPDGFGTRVLSLKADPAHEYELSEFIILTPQAAYPLEVLPEVLVEAIGPEGRKWTFRSPTGTDELDRMRKARSSPAIYRLRMHKDEPDAAIYFNPQDLKFPEIVFPPFTDRGQIVTPCYWGSHWPLARGNATGSAIDSRIALTPCHNSVMSWAHIQPEPFQAARRMGLDAQGHDKKLSFRQWVWLVGMSNASDQELGMWATSFAAPASLETHGGRLDFESYDARRRAFRIHVQDRAITIKVKPQTVCVNPVFELADAPAGPLMISGHGVRMSPDAYAWDGRTLWIHSTIKQATDFTLEFLDLNSRPVPAPGQH